MRLTKLAAILLPATLITGLLLSGGAGAGTEVVRTERISFEQCNEVIRRTAGQLGVAPVNVVETNDIRMGRFPTNDGSGESILVTCSKPDRKMVINRSW